MELIFLLFSQERHKRTPLSGPLIQEKAINLNKMMNGDPNLSASNGWLDSWKKEHGIRQLILNGESLYANHPSAQKYVTKFAG